jgi:protein-S-isoprenylcysteine O-methyltransferase Ste14
MMALWLQRHYATITACFGGLLLIMAVVAPIISPANQRGEIVIMTILFGLIGALMLFKAIAPGRSASVTETPVQRQTNWSGGAAHAGISSVARLSLRARQARRARIRAFVGAAFGLIFALSGMLAPFVLSEGATSADARFAMMIGFTPVVISGALLVWVFGKLLLAGKERRGNAAEQRSEAPAGEVKGESILSTLSNVSISSGILMVVCAVVLPFVVSDVARPGMITTAVLMVGIGIGLSLLGVGIRRGEYRTTPPGPRPVVRRAPVPRVPGSVLYRIVVPAAIGLAVLLIVAVIVVVIIATAAPLVH